MKVGDRFVVKEETYVFSRGSVIEYVEPYPEGGWGHTPGFKLVSGDCIYNDHGLFYTRHGVAGAYIEFDTRRFAPASKQLPLFE